MTAGGFDCDAARTEQIAAAMTTATDPLDAAAGRAPEVPNAGIATGAVVDLLTSLAGAMGDLTRATEGTGRQVSHAVGTYRGADGGAAGTINGVSVPGPMR